MIYDSFDLFSKEESRDLGFLLQEALKATQKELTQVQKIAVNIGPGGTNSIRSGVAFANALSYSLKIPTYAFNAFEAMGIQAWQQFEKPVLSTVRAMKNTAYIGLYQNGNLQSMSYGKLDEELAIVLANLDDFVVAGYHREAVIELYPNKKITDSGISQSRAKTVLDLPNIFKGEGTQFPHILKPVTEQLENV